MSRKTDCHELAVVESTRLLAGDFPAGELDVVEADPPDVCLSGEERIAIEVTRYMAGSGRDSEGAPIRAIHGQQERILQDAKMLHAKSSSRAIVVDAIWYPSHDPLRKLTRKEVQLITRTVEVVVTDLEQRADWDVVDHDALDFQVPAGHPLAPYIHSITALGGRHICQELWAVPHAEMLHDDSVGFQACIKRKEQDLSRYVADYDQAWLVVDVPWTGWGDIGPQVVSATYTARFDRVYFHDGQSRRVFRAV